MDVATCITDHPVYSETAAAYGDCALGAKRGAARNLGFRASQSVEPKVAAEIMRQCVPHGYNEFDGSLLELLPADCKVFLAREGSVCIYVVRGEEKLPSSRVLKEDERNVLKKDSFNSDEYYQGGRPENDRPTPCGGFKGEVRLWWD